MATFDARKNFAKVTVSTGYDASATTIVLGSGHGARLPLPSADGEFNLVWWNNTDYGDPTDDPNREIVRCTARSTDTLTVVRAQEGEAAAIKNIAGKTYRMALTITKKVIDDIIDNVGASSTLSVAQGSHGFVLGDVLKNTSTDNVYAKAQADSGANAEVIGIVTQVVDAGNFVITTSGYVDTAGAVPAATAGTVLFLSPTTAGALTATEPTTAGQISKPLAIIQDNDDTMVFFNWRGALISDVDLPTQTYITVKLGTEADGDDNRTFSLTTGSFTAGKYLSVYKNGQLQEESATADYVTSGTTIAYFNAAVLDTDKITLVVRSYTVENMEDPLTTAGDIIYRNATVPARLPVGTATYRLAVNSGATAPEWVKPDMVLPVAIADQAFAGITETGTAGATLAFGDLCYFQAADSRWELADANLSAGYDKKLGMCVLAAAADGSATNLLLIGKIRADSKFPTMTIGSAVYMSETAGAIVVAQPTTADACIRVVGFANTADELYFNPSPDYIIHT